MTIVVTGGGSGGHITPVLAVANRLRQLEPGVRLVYVGQKRDGLADIPKADKAIDAVYEVQAGKLRRYHGEGWKQLLDIKTLILNVRDSYRVLAGFFQSIHVLRKERPDCVFVKGGFVGVPVGLAAAMLRIPYVTHDSDAIPGLANRLIAPWARYHAVALPKELYQYPPHKTVTVGVPVAETFKYLTADAQKKYKVHLKLPPAAPVLLVTGGGLGAQRLNAAILAVVKDLLKNVSDLHLIHIAGRLNEQHVQSSYEQILSPEEQGRVHVIGYTSELYRYSGAADLIVTRAGATAIAEFAVQGKACVLVPNPYLTAGHQLKNADALQKSKAVAVIEEKALASDLPLVLSTISGLLEDEATRQEMAQRLQALSHQDAAGELAEVLLKTAKRHSTGE